MSSGPNFIRLKFWSGRRSTVPGAVRKEYLVALLGSQRVKSTRLAKNVCRVLTRRLPRAELGSSAQLRVLELLKPVAASERSLSLPEITTAVGVSKPTVFRMCQRLDAAGYPELQPGGRRFGGESQHKRPPDQRMGSPLQRAAPRMTRRLACRVQASRIALQALGYPTVCESSTWWSCGRPRASAMASRSIHARMTVASPWLAANRYTFCEIAPAATEA